MIDNFAYAWFTVYNSVVTLIYGFFLLCGIYVYITAVYEWFKTRKYSKAITYLAVPILIVTFWVWNSLYTLITLVLLTILALLTWLLYYLVNKDWKQWWIEYRCDHDMKTRLRDCGYYTQCTKCGHGYYRDYGR